ncbi:MAG: hypothetical protein JRD89_01325 [Deltaproteobacteria bacterium]|nr:hypothetical protein [Deltaproteobacteria bacterium]
MISGRTIAEALGERIPQPYPLTFPRTLDFIPLHSLQSQVDPEQEIYFYVGNVSIPISQSEGIFRRNKEHDLTIRQNPINRTQTTIKFGGTNNDTTITQKELWNIIQDEMGFDTIPELAIRVRGLRNHVPENLYEYPELQDAEYVYQLQVSRGNRTKSFRERFGLWQLTNPTRLIKNELIERGIWRRRYSKRIRSLLRTECITAGDGEKRKGWEELFKMPIAHLKGQKKYRFPPLSAQLNRELISNKWHHDMGIPSALTGKIDSLKMQSVVYLLAKRHKVIVI